MNLSRRGFIGGLLATTALMPAVVRAVPPTQFIENARPRFILWSEYNEAANWNPHEGIGRIDGVRFITGDP